MLQFDPDSESQAAEPGLSGNPKATRKHQIAGKKLSLDVEAVRYQAEQSCGGPL